MVSEGGMDEEGEDGDERREGGRGENMGGEGGGGGDQRLEAGSLFK